jgi:hypothetical protein
MGINISSILLMWSVWLTDWLRLTDWHWLTDWLLLCSGSHLICRCSRVLWGLIFLRFCLCGLSDWLTDSLRLTDWLTDWLTHSLRLTWLTNWDWQSNMWICLNYYSNPLGFYVKTMSAHDGHFGWRLWYMAEAKWWQKHSTHKW